MININKVQKISGLFQSLDEMFSTEMPEIEEVIFGVRRGEVAQIASVTNLGKSTLLNNLCLSAAAGQTFAPFLDKPEKPLRVLFIDFETRRAIFRDYLRKMISGISNKQTAQNNFISIVDGMINGDHLNLSDPKHLNLIAQTAREMNIDLIVIDPVAVAFDLNNENDNAEVTKRAVKPLCWLAQETNAAVIFSHHIGKPNESAKSEQAYAGRGASAWGALSRAVFTLSRDELKGEGYLILQCAKLKGRKFAPVLLKLNHDTHWFELCAEKPHIREPVTVQEIVDFVSKKTEKVKLSEIIQSFNEHSDSTIKRRIEEALKFGLLKSAGYGYYISTRQSPYTTFDSPQSVRVEGSRSSQIN